MKYKRKIKAMLCVVVSLCIAVLSVFCVYKRATRCFSVYEDTALMAAYCVMPDGFLYNKNSSDKVAANSIKSDKKQQTEKSQLKDTSQHLSEKTYPISQINLAQGNVSYDNFSIKNTTSYQPDIGALLKAKLDFEINDTRKVQVLIVHTHTCESYMEQDSGFYYESFYPRSTDNNKNVCAVGKKIADKLKENGIGVVHAVTQHDNPSYDGAYSRSYDTISTYLEKYKEIKVVLDIHRDSMTQDDNTKLKPTFTFDGKKGAQIMIMSGYDCDGTFSFFEENLKFALKLQSKCETLYPGMTRPLYFGNFTYNMNVNSGSLLIEIGTDANTLDEALYSGELLGNALVQVLQNE